MGHVLVVDDEPMVLYSVKRILESEGIQVEVAESGQACLEVLRKGFKGLILMDIIMPGGMDGWDTIETIVKEGFSEGNIICMLTGKEEPGEKMEKLKEYVLDYIKKPFKKDDLVNIVNDYLAYLK